MCFFFVSGFCFRFFGSCAVLLETGVTVRARGRCLRVLLLTGERRERGATVLLLVVVRRLTVRGRRASVRRRRRRVPVHANVRRRASAILATHRGRRTAVVHARVRRHVLRRRVVHRGTHAVEVTSGGHAIVAVVPSSTVPHAVVRLALDLGLDALAVRRVPDHGEDRADRLDQLGALSRFGVIESGLHDVVRKAGKTRPKGKWISASPAGRYLSGESSRVAEKTLEPLLDEELVDDRTSTGAVGDSNALLDDVGRELLSRESRDVAEELTDDRLDEAVVVQVENVLDDVVTLQRDRRGQVAPRVREREGGGRAYESVLNERERVVRDLGDELDALTLGRVVDAALEDAASVTVGRDFDAVCRDGVVNELVVFGREVVEALLDHVVAVQVLDERHDVEVEREDQALHLALRRQEVDHLLNGARSVHVERDRDELARDRFDQRVTLLVRRVLEEALGEVVGERVRHELGEMRENLVEDHVSVLWVAVLELLLEVAAAELVLAEREHVCVTPEPSVIASVAGSDLGNALTTLKILEPEPRESVRAHPSRVPVTARAERATRACSVIHERVRVVNVSSRSSSEERSGEGVDDIRRCRWGERLGVEVELRPTSTIRIEHLSGSSPLWGVDAAKGDERLTFEN